MDPIFQFLQKRSFCQHRPAQPDCVHCRAGFSYLTRSGTIGFDAFPGFPTAPPNERDMTAEIVFARGRNRDRKGDMMEIGGIKTKSHFFNRIAMLDHGKYYPLPIGKCSPIGQPETKENYGVTLNTREQVAKSKIHFWQDDAVAYKIFDGCVKGIFKAGSIGARPIKCALLPPDLPNGIPGGVHYLEVELVEPTVTAIPVNQEAVRDYMEMDVVGKTLDDFIRKSLEPFAAPLRAWTTGIGETNVAEVTKDMSAMSSSSGGAMVKPPQHGATPPDTTKNLQKTGSPAGPAMMDEQHARKSPPQSYGKQLIEKWREDFADQIQELEYDLGPCDHPVVRPALEKVLKKLRAMQAEVHEIMGKAFGASPAAAPAPVPDAVTAEEEDEEELEEGETEVLDAEEKAGASEAQAEEEGAEEEAVAGAAAKPGEEKAVKPEEKKKKKPPFAKTEKSAIDLVQKFLANQQELALQREQIAKQKTELDSRLAKVS